MRYKSLLTENSFKGLSILGVLPGNLESNSIYNLVNSLASEVKSNNEIISTLESVFTNIRNQWKKLLVGLGLTLVGLFAIISIVKKGITLLDQKMIKSFLKLETALAPFKEKYKNINYFFNIVQHNPEIFRKNMSSEDIYSAIKNLPPFSSGVVNIPIYKDEENLEALKDQLPELVKLAHKYNSDSKLLRIFSIAKTKYKLTRLNVWLKYLIIVVLVVSLFGVMSKLIKNVFEKHPQDKNQNFNSHIQENTLQSSNKSNIVIRVLNNLGERITKLLGLTRGQLIVVCTGLAFLSAIALYTKKTTSFREQLFSIWKNGFKLNLQSTLFFVGCACSVLTIILLFGGN